MPDAREVLAVIVTLGSFGLLAGYIFTGGHLDSGTGVGLVAFTSGSLGSVLGFYFGKTNGAQTAMAHASAELSTQAIQAAINRRAGDFSAPLTPVAAVVLAAPPAPKADAGPPA